MNPSAAGSLDERQGLRSVVGDAASPASTWNGALFGEDAIANLTGITNAGGSGALAPARRYDHVFVVWMENRSASEIYNNPEAVFINSLRARGETFTEMHAVARPSQPNYLATYSGSTQGVTDNGAHLFNKTTLGDQIAGLGLRFRMVAEADAPAKHIPTTSFTGDHAYQRVFEDYWPGQLANLRNTAQMVWVTPNDRHNMHDGTIREADNWLRTNFTPVINFAANPANNSLFILTFDEGNKDDRTNHIPTLAVGAGIRGGTVDHTRLTLYSLLQEFEDAYGLARLGGAQTAADLIFG